MQYFNFLSLEVLLLLVFNVEMRRGWKALYKPADVASSAAAYCYKKPRIRVFFFFAIVAFQYLSFGCYLCLGKPVLYLQHLHWFCLFIQSYQFNTLVLACFDSWVWLDPAILSVKLLL